MRYVWSFSPYSPDLSWIENVWAWHDTLLDRYKADLKTAQDLRNPIEMINESLPHSHCKRNVNSIQIRFQRLNLETTNSLKSDIYLCETYISLANINISSSTPGNLSCMQSTLLFVMCIWQSSIHLLIAVLKLEQLYDPPHYFASNLSPRPTHALPVIVWEIWGPDLQADLPRCILAPELIRGKLE